MRDRVRTVLGVCLLLLAAGGCKSAVEVRMERDSDPASPGSLRSVARIGHYSASGSRVRLWWAGVLDALPVEHGVMLYRLEYWTTGPRREQTYASGLVALPNGAALRGVVSYQHPTRTARENVPSTPSQTALLTAIAFAGHGYVLAAPDYLGLGTSPGSHPYLHAETEASATIDLLRAARVFLRQQGREWPPTLLLTGFSQGGHASLAAQRALEADPVEDLQVTASAAIAGNYNLSRIQFRAALDGRSERHSMYLGYLISTYARVYDDQPSSVISDVYARHFAVLYDGSKDTGEVAAALPADPKEMFRPEFLQAFAAGQESWLTRALARNDVFDWTPQAPIRFYYGTGDQDSPAADSRFTAEHMNRRGGKVTAVDLGEKDHNAVAFAALPQVRSWFDQITEQTARAKQ